MFLRVTDDVINHVVSGRTSHPSLSQTDIFYTTVSELGEFFPALIQYQMESMKLLKASQDK